MAEQASEYGAAHAEYYIVVQCSSGVNRAFLDHFIHHLQHMSFGDPT